MSKFNGQPPPLSQVVFSKLKQQAATINRQGREIVSLRDKVNELAQISNNHTQMIGAIMIMLDMDADEVSRIAGEIEIEVEEDGE